jgi:hypothetical protein
MDGLQSHHHAEETQWQRANRLGRASFKVLSSDRRLLIFPALSALVNLLIGGLSFALADHLIDGHSHSRRLILLGGLIAAYPATFVGIFSGVALAAMLARKLDGQPIEVSEAWQFARERTGIILGWTLLVCTVGAVLRIAEEYLPLGGRIVAFVLDLSWSLATLFAVPVIAYEGLTPRATLRRSGELFRERWGEQTLGLIGLTVAGGFLAVPGVILIGAGAAGSGTSAVLLVAAGGALICAVQAYTIALNQVYRVYLYRSLLAGAPLPGPFPANDLETPFRPRRKHWWNKDDR